MSSFTTPLKYKFTGSTRRGRKEFRLTEDFIYEVGKIDSNSFVEVKTGFVTDLASVPWPICYLIPPNGKYAKAAVVHDFLYEVGTTQEERKYADDIFLEAMETLKVPWWQRMLLYRAVRIFGSQGYGKIERG